jgi:phage terminase large subunit GpA-like protein
MFERASRLFKPTPRMTPDEWGAANREYGPGSGRPGKRDPKLTPYTIDFGRVAASGEYRGKRYRRAVLAMFAQGGKSEMLIDLIGERMTNAPAPILYVGPNKQFLNEQWSPRMDELLAVPVIKDRLTRKRMTMTRKVISGQPLRLAHAGSSTALKSDPAALALTDEADELMKNVKGQGDPVGLVDARGDTQPEFVHAIVSTPSTGPKEVERDPESGLEFWKEQPIDEIESKIWRLWQEGTRYHFAVPCSECGDYFIPRFECLSVGKDWIKVSPADARTNAVLLPPCGCVIPDDKEKRRDMRDRGVFVAPGQRVEQDGTVTGEPPDAECCSFWASGLVSPFKSFGDHAARYAEALRSGDQETIKTVVNQGFGELWAPVGGEVPEWDEVRKLALPYDRGTVPHGAVFLTAGVDVQKNRLVFVVRGWGARSESWLVDQGELWGETDQDAVWSDLDALLLTPYDGMVIRRAFIDSGFRPGKKDLIPEHKVYEFARRNTRTTYATKGFDQRRTPLSVNRIEVNAKGAKAKVGLDLISLDSDFFKSWVHARIRWPEDQPGGWHLFDGIGEDYCRQIVSEARAKKPGGGHQWISRTRDNHFLDAEALSYAAAFMMGVQRIPDDAARPEDRKPVEKRPQQAISGQNEPKQAGNPQKSPEIGGKPEKRRSSWL